MINLDMSLNLIVPLLAICVNFVYSIERNDIWYLCPTDQGDCEDADCDIIEAATRAGYLCDSFPWYSGGQWPTEWNDEDEYYTCQDVIYTNETGTLESSACRRWSANEYSGQEIEIGECQCFEFSDNSQYCTSWGCYQTEGGYSEFSTLSFSICRVEDITTQVGPSYTLSNQNIYCADDPLYDYELLRCYCLSEYGNSYYCEEWYCNQYDINTEEEETYKESEYYECTANRPNVNSPYYENDNYQFNDNLFCWQWYGNINSDNEFELTDCECKAVRNNYYCSDWYCYEKGMEKYTVDMDSGEMDDFGVSLCVSIIGSVVCIASTVLCSRICNPFNMTCVYFVMIFTFGVFGTICVLMGGIASLMIWVIIWAGLLQYFWVKRPTKSCIAWDVICGCTCCPFESHAEVGQFSGQ